LKINFPKVACFSEVKIEQFSNHNPPAFHHEFTIKKPRPTVHFLQNPIKNARQT